MTANGQPCKVCGQLAQVEHGSADGSTAYFCLPHAEGAFETGSAQYATPNLTPGVPPGADSIAQAEQPATAPAPDVQFFDPNAYSTPLG